MGRWNSRCCTSRVRTTRGPCLDSCGALGWAFQHGGQAFLLSAELEMQPTADGSGLHGRAVLRAGERRRLSLSHATRDMLVIPPLGAAADGRLERTVQWWRRWSAQCRFDHRHRPAVLRSALALKLLAYGLSGAVVAAATTALPEAVGGGRNYDYRYCWLRDAATTLRAFSDLGFAHEGRAYLAWLLHSTRLTRPRLMVLYDVHGRTRQPKQELSHLRGYGGSAPCGWAMTRLGSCSTMYMVLPSPLPPSMWSAAALWLGTSAGCSQASGEWCARPGASRIADCGRSLARAGTTSTPN